MTGAILGTGIFMGRAGPFPHGVHCLPSCLFIHSLTHSFIHSFSLFLSHLLIYPLYIESSKLLDWVLETQS